MIEQLAPKELPKAFKNRLRLREARIIAAYKVGSKTKIVDFEEAY
jgi:hypothetical protein